MSKNNVSTYKESRCFNMSYFDCTDNETKLHSIYRFEYTNIRVGK